MLSSALVSDRGESPHVPIPNGDLTPYGVVMDALPNLTREQEQDLAQCGRHKDRRAIESLTLANLRRAHKKARDYAIRQGLPMHSVDDFVQEAVVGLLTAARKFERRGFRFGTLAHNEILAQLMRCEKQTRFTIRIPSGEWANRHQYARAVPSCDQKLALAEDLHSNVPERVERRDLQARLHRALAVLSDRDAQIVAMRFGMQGHKEHTLQMIGVKFGMSRERVRQILLESIEELRSPEVAPSLRRLL